MASVVYLGCYLDFKVLSGLEEAKKRRKIDWSRNHCVGMGSMKFYFVVSPGVLVGL